MTWVAIQATTPRDAYWKLTQAFFTARDESLRSQGPFYVLNNLVLEMSQPGVGDLTPADGHFTIHRWRKYLSDYTDGFFREFLGQCLRAKQHREVLQRDPDFLFNLSYNRYRILGKALRRKRAGTIREKIVPELILKDRGTHGLEDS